MKVYNIRDFVNGQQRYVIVAAKSKTAAVRALNDHGLKVSMYFFNGWGGETGNPLDIEVATSQPGRVFYTDMNVYRKSADEYILLPLREERQA